MCTKGCKGRALRAQRLVMKSAKAGHEWVQRLCVKCVKAAMKGAKGTIAGCRGCKSCMQRMQSLGIKVTEDVKAGHKV